MKLEIKLKDPKYCDGCPLLTWRDETWVVTGCGKEYELKLTQWQGKNIVRPQRCIEDNQE